MSEQDRPPSFLQSLLAYRRERLPMARFGVLALFLAVVAGASGLERAPALVLAWLLVAVFRLRDDLADREHDRERHPERVLVRAASVQPFELATRLGLLACAALLIALRDLASAGCLLALAAAFELGYRLELPGRHRWVLLKYPAFVALLGEQPSLSLLSLVYLSFVVFERVDDPALRSRADATLRLGAYLLAAGVIAAHHLLVAKASLVWLALLLATWTFAVALALASASAEKPRALAPLGLFFVTLIIWSHDPSRRSADEDDHLIRQGIAHARDAQLLLLW